MKSWHSLGVKPRAPGLSCQCSDHYQPSQSSMYTSQMSASVAVTQCVPSEFHYGLTKKISSPRKKPCWVILSCYGEFSSLPLTEFWQHKLVDLPGDCGSVVRALGNQSIARHNRLCQLLASHFFLPHIIERAFILIWLVCYCECVLCNLQWCWLTGCFSNSDLL